MRGSGLLQAGGPRSTLCRGHHPLRAAARGPQGADYDAWEARPGGLPAWPAGAGAWPGAGGRGARGTVPPGR